MPIDKIIQALSDFENNNRIRHQEIKEHLIKIDLRISAVEAHVVAMKLVEVINTGTIGALKWAIAILGMSSILSWVALFLWVCR